MCFCSKDILAMSCGSDECKKLQIEWDVANTWKGFPVDKKRCPGCGAGTREEDSRWSKMVDAIFKEPFPLSPQLQPGVQKCAKCFKPVITPKVIKGLPVCKLCLENENE